MAFFPRLFQNLLSNALRALRYMPFINTTTLYITALRVIKLWFKGFNIKNNLLTHIIMKSDYKGLLFLVNDNFTRKRIKLVFK